MKFNYLVDFNFKKILYILINNYLHIYIILINTKKFVDIDQCLMFIKKVIGIKMEYSCLN